MTTDVPSAGDRAAIARRLMEESWNAGDFRLIDEFVDTSFVSHDPGPEDVRGPEALKQVIAAQREAFPDFRFEIQELLVHEDKLVARWRASGTHRGEFMGLAATGRRAAVEGISIDRWAGDRIVETWIAYDTLTILQQIGAAPAPGSAIERIGKRAQRIAVRSRQLRRRGSRWVHARRNRVHASG
jgi:predicted ester cyclase